MPKELPVVGAAMFGVHLDAHLDWLAADARDLEIQDAYLPMFLDADDVQAQTNEIKAKLAGYPGRVGVHGPFIDIPLATYDPRIREVVGLRFRQALDFCAEIGATHMVLHSPFRFLGEPNHLSDPTVGPFSFFDAAHQTLQSTLAYAESIGCTLVIENILDKHPAILTALVQSFESPVVRQSLDTGHAYIKYGEGAPPPDYWVRTAGSMLMHVHLQDTDGYSDRHWAVGRGKIDWHELFTALGELDTMPRLILELMEYDEIPLAAAWLADHGLAR